jgi:UDP-N-acetylmuramyl pentapeptide phosphotransferase/UDP-N-acetylglucosamine-1-phosphate transferase
MNQTRHDDRGRRLKTVTKPTMIGLLFVLTIVIQVKLKRNQVHWFYSFKVFLIWLIVTAQPGFTVISQNLTIDEKSNRP